MAKKTLVEIAGQPCEVAVGRVCQVCLKAHMAIWKRAAHGSNETQHLRCPNCDATATREVNVLSGATLIDSDFQSR